LIVYLYALVADGAAPRRLFGIAREKVRCIKLGPFTVALGELRAVPRITARALRAHDRTVTLLGKRFKAVLPFRFGSAVNDVATAKAVLGARRPALRTALVAVHGREQMTVRVFEPPAALSRAGARSRARAVAARGPRVDRSMGPGARYLDARARPGRDAAARVAPLRSAVEGLVFDERMEVHGSPPSVITLSHLIERGRESAYRRQVERAAALLAPARVTVMGPRPPYAFASDPALASKLLASALP
jgi:hypothetical protein